MLGLLVGRRLDLDGSFEAVRGAAARVEGDEAREDESRHGADGRRDDDAGVVAAVAEKIACLTQKKNPLGFPVKF